MLRRDKNRSLKEYFEDKFIPEPNSGCWLWLGALDHDGYGSFYVKRNVEPKAHRFSYELYCEPIPENLSVLHKCDNPCCVNPDHLFVGTQDDNMKDMKNKGRHRNPEINGLKLHPEKAARGEKVNTAKLTEKDCYKVVEYYKQGYTQKQISEIYNVHYTTIGGVINGRYWKHLNLTKGENYNEVIG